MKHTFVTIPNGLFELKPFIRGKEKTKFDVIQDGSILGTVSLPCIWNDGIPRINLWDITNVFKKRSWMSESSTVAGSTAANIELIKNPARYKSMSQGLTMAKTTLSIYS